MTRFGRSDHYSIILEMRSSHLWLSPICVSFPSPSMILSCDSPSWPHAPPHRVDISFYQSTSSLSSVFLRKNTDIIPMENRKDSPPPAYSDIPSIPTDSHSAQPSVAPSTAPSGLNPIETPFAGPAFHHHNVHSHTFVYGPTPFPHQSQNGVLLPLPYYDPHSPYSMEQAISRARWRFFGALLWAIGIWIAFGIVTGGIVVDIHRS